MEFINDTNEPIYKTEADSHIENRPVRLPRGQGGTRGINEELGVSGGKLLCVK